MKAYIKSLSEKIFQELLPNEELGLFLHSEESLFLRFNSSKIRQNTTVTQHELTLTLQKDHKSLRAKFNLTLDSETDFINAEENLQNLRAQLFSTDENPQYVPLNNGGITETYKYFDRPADHQIPDFIHSVFSDCDLAGFWCSGPLRQASLNSKGQFHYFETDNYFFDYSIYQGPLAAKGFYASETWDELDFKSKAQKTKNKLSLLLKPKIHVPKGQYKVYLEPMALAEIIGTLGWGAFSHASFLQGRAPLKKLKNRESQFSSKFSMLENFDLGLSPLFNSIGEISTPQVALIEKGELVQFLTSSATAKEYNLISNQASGTESPRSPEIRAGSLEQNDILKELGTGLYLSNLHYINWSDIPTARITGMTRFACFWVENGEIQGPLQDLRFDDTLYSLFGDNLIDFTKEQEVFVDSSTYSKRSLGGMKVPGALINNFNFTL